MTRTFVILNDSKANVIITEIQKTCVCISAELNQQRLKPGEEGTLHLKINTVLQHGPIGGFLSIIWHYEDQPLTHTLKIGFRGNVETVLDITPQVVDFGTVTDNDSIQTQDIQLNRGDFEEDWNSISVRATAGIAKTETSDRASITSELVSLGANRLTFRCIFHSNGHQDQSGKLLINVLEQEKLKTITVPVIAYVP